MNSLKNRIGILSWIAASLMALVIAGCGGGSGGNSPPAAGTLAAAAVTSTSPASGAVGVGTNAKITASFSRSMAAASISAATFTTAAGSASVTGAVTFDAANNIATFAPAAALAANTVYTATLTTGVQDSTGNGLAANYVWSFTTGAGADTTPPQVTSTSPAGGSLQAVINGKITATFSETMDASTMTAANFTVSSPGNVAVTGTVTYSGSTAVFTPSANLAASTVYTATISGSVKDLAGNALASGPVIWAFTTAAFGDSLAPTVSSTSIANGATGIALNVKVSAFFSEAMDPFSVSTSSFIVTQGSAQVAGTVSYIGGVATFNPSAALAANTVFTATISTSVKDLAGNAMASNYVWSWTTGAGSQSGVPAVSFTDPASGAVNVATNKQIAVTFNAAMDALTVTSANFTLQGPGAAIVAGTVTYAGVTATFTPTGGLAVNTLYTATVSTGMRDLSGNALAANYSWSFTTGTTGDTTAPAVSATIPVNQSTGVATNAIIAVTFTEAINASTISSANFTLTGPGGAAIAGSVHAAGNVATFTPAANLLTNSTFIATISTGVRDLAGNAMAAAYSFSFTTGAAVDTTPPTVSSTLPGNGATAVVLNQTVSITFSEAMDAKTINTSTVSLAGPGTTAVAGTVVYYSGTNVASFTPSVNLAANTIYTATVTTGVKDLKGNAMLASKVWSFTTGLTTGGLATVNMRSLSSFALVAGAGLVSSNSGGQTLITGNVGLSPVASCLGDALPCTASNPQINGTLFANDAGGVAATAKSDLLLAYADAAGRAPGIPVNDVTGRVLASGVYTSATTVSIASGGVLTLDAAGDPNAVWIFQVGSALSINNNARVVLINGAKANNVFWAVAGAASIGAQANFAGTVLAGTSNSVGSGTSVIGRLLCTSGQASLLSDTITVPGP